MCFRHLRGRRWAVGIVLSGHWFSAIQVLAVYPRHIVSYCIIFSFLPRIITIELIDLSFDICFLVSF